MPAREAIPVTDIATTTTPSVIEPTATDNSSTLDGAETEAQPESVANDNDSAATLANAPRRMPFLVISAKKRSIRLSQEADEIVDDRFAQHLVVDNYGAHKTAAVEAWLAKHPRFHLHFTPTSAINLGRR